MSVFQSECRSEGKCWRSVADEEREQKQFIAALGEELSWGYWEFVQRMAQTREQRNGGGTKSGTVDKNMESYAASARNRAREA